MLSLLLMAWAKVNGDIIYQPYKGFGPAISLEFIGSYEYAFTRHNTVNFWGGAGMVSLVPNLFMGPSLGTEFGLELRYYFKNQRFEKFNLDLYGGFGCMKNYEIMHYKIYEAGNTFGFVPGIKFTYKKKISPLFVMEPYISLSYPCSNDRFKGLFDSAERKDKYLCLTLGFRIGLNKVKQKEA